MAANITSVILDILRYRPCDSKDKSVEYNEKITSVNTKAA
jgi:hypothetical protein